jgi:hypothetical protein
LSSSANITGKPIATSMLELNVSFKQELDFIIAPKKNNTEPSHIINAHTQERILECKFQSRWQTDCLCFNGNLYLAIITCPILLAITTTMAQ